MKGKNPRKKTTSCNIDEVKLNNKSSRKSGDNSKKKKKKMSEDKEKNGGLTGYVHVRARRGQATDSHSLAERVHILLCNIASLLNLLYVYYASYLFNWALY